jgi:hypothetical protein
MHGPKNKIVEKVPMEITTAMVETVIMKKVIIVLMIT